MEIEIGLLRFDEISKRHDIKKPKWFALDNDLFSHPDFFKLTGDEFKAWIWICSVASKVNKPKIRLDTEVFAHQCKCKESVFHSTIQKLEGKRLSVQIRTDSSAIRTNPSLHNTTDTTLQTLQTEHDTTNTTEARPRSVFVHTSFDTPFLKAFIEKVPEKVQISWFETYPDHEWISLQIKEAVSWIHAEPTKAPKSNFAKFFTSWLSRSWEWKRKNNSKGPKITRANLEETA